MVATGVIWRPWGRHRVPYVPPPPSRGSEGDTRTQPPRPGPGACPRAAPALRHRGRWHHVSPRGGVASGTPYFGVPSVSPRPHLCPLPLCPSSLWLGATSCPLSPPGVLSISSPHGCPPPVPMAPTTTLCPFMSPCPLLSPCHLLSPPVLPSPLPYPHIPPCPQNPTLPTTPIWPPTPPIPHISPKSPISPPYPLSPHTPIPQYAPMSPNAPYVP